MLRVLHTSDWHLGHTLHGWPRESEHRAFFDWLLDTIARHEVDALIVAGDLFETANPPASAFRQLYTFLGELRQRMADLDVVLVGGNHDSAQRLDAHIPLFDELGIHVVGGLARLGDGRLDPGRVAVPLRDHSGSMKGVVAAVPYLRTSDLPTATDDDDEDRDPLIEGVRAVYAEALDLARARRDGAEVPGDVAVLATGHCYMSKTKLSELSERKILGGNQHALPLDVFPEDIAYVALGHLHLAQAVDRVDQVRYSGSPIPLSLAEADYEHQVLLIDFDGAELHEVVPLYVPRSVELIRVPEEVPGALQDVLNALGDLEVEADPDDVETWPYLEVRVLLDAPEPRIRELVEAALGSRPVRVLRIGVEYGGFGLALADQPRRQELHDLSPQDVFMACYERRYGEPATPELLAAFHELVDEVSP